VGDGVAVGGEGDAVGVAVNGIVVGEGVAVAGRPVADGEAGIAAEAAAAAVRAARNCVVPIAEHAVPEVRVTRARTSPDILPTSNTAYVVPSAPVGRKAISLCPPPKST